jgi:hypothetical protein
MILHSGVHYGERTASLLLYIMAIEEHNLHGFTGAKDDGRCIWRYHGILVSWCMIGLDTALCYGFRFCLQ